MKKVMSILMACFFLFSCVTNHYTEEDYSDYKKPISMGTSIVTSLIPGLPQFMNGEIIEGVVYSSLGVGSLFAIVLSPNDVSDPVKYGFVLTFYGSFLGSLIDGLITTSRRNSEYNTIHIADKNEKARIKREQRAIERELRLSKFTEKERDAIENEQFFLGMSRLALIESIGEPDDINETVGSWGVHEQFVYSSYDLYVYLENGIVTSWQK